MKNVLIACEESQTVCKAFRKLGFNAYSCDILPCSGGHPEWHLHCDVLGVIRDKRGTLETGDEFVLDGEWDLMIAHPPCTYLSVSGARWYYHPEDKDLPIEQRRPHLPAADNAAGIRHQRKRSLLRHADLQVMSHMPFTSFRGSYILIPSLYSHGKGKTEPPNLKLFSISHKSFSDVFGQPPRSRPLHGQYPRPASP